jgi:hypothetical protein
MNFRWENGKERTQRGIKMSPEKKLEGIRLMNELADKVLSNRQKLSRQKSRENN